MIDLDKLEKTAQDAVKECYCSSRSPDYCDNCFAADELRYASSKVLALIAELRAARKVVDAAFTVSCLEILFPYCEDLSLALINYDKVVEGRE